MAQDRSEKRGHEMPANCSMSSPEQSLSGSFTDIPLLLINGVPHRDSKKSPSSDDEVAQKPFTCHSESQVL